MIGVDTSIAVLATPPLLGFTASGVAAGYLAAAIQSAVYGAAVPTGSLFAIMQSVGATATIVPALIAGASATGIAGAVEASQAQGPGGSGEEEGEARDGANEQSWNVDEEKRDEDKEEFAKLVANPGNENKRVSSLHGEAPIRVASLREDGNPRGYLLNAGQGGEVFRPRNNQS
ncbi:unnamed protein product [Rhizoctonia solani]|uniref:Uncharacterized protein n=1 Tax=Rhizoctonia solani TaxID=456999 RepID=A0A8H2Y413_9AGAM|nr:unnamed protein product [Rhizoctonia solani]